MQDRRTANAGGKSRSSTGWCPVFVEAVHMRAGTEVTGCQRRGAGAMRGVRGRGCEVEGAKVPTTPKASIWRSVSRRVTHGQGRGVRAKARVHTRQVERAMCTGAGVRNWDAEGQRRRWRAGGKQQAALLRFRIEN
jgi:hypothetical protein